MKLLRAFLLSSLILVSSTALAVSKYTSETVSAPPKPVASAHVKTYGSLETAWKKNSWSNDEGKQVTVYVGWLFKDKKAHRVAYEPGGKAYLTIVYLGGAAGLPSAIKDALLKAHPGYEITAAQRYHAAGMKAYRTELRKGSTKIVKWTDSRGTEISKDNLPEGAEELLKK